MKTAKDLKVGDTLYFVDAINPMDTQHSKIEIVPMVITKIDYHQTHILIDVINENTSPKEELSTSFDINANWGRYQRSDFELFFIDKEEAIKKLVYFYSYWISRRDDQIKNMRNHINEILPK